MKNKVIKKKRNKPGHKMADRLCRLCGEMIPIDKCLNMHHLSYKSNITVPLHYTCHSIVHCRVKFHHPYMKKFGKDLGPLAAARAVIQMYERYPQVIKEMDIQNKLNMPDTVMCGNRKCKTKNTCYRFRPQKEKTQDHYNLDVDDACAGYWEIT